MLQEERHLIILSQIRQQNKVHTSELCQLLDVSVDTVRRDLNELERNGKLVKVHGGAISKGFHHPFQQPEVHALEEKKKIAQKAAGLIKDGMVLLLGGGTVILELTRLIPQNLKGTLFTVSPLVALEATQRSTIDVILIGGRVLHNSYICTGASVISQLTELRADMCMMGTNGLSFQDGVTDFDWEVVQVKKAMIRSAEKTVILCISEKIGTSQKLKVATLQEIDCLVTELEPKDERLGRFSDILSIR